MSDGCDGFRIDGTGAPYSLRPWVGPRYWKEGLRILVHGDSYYATNEDGNRIEEWHGAVDNGEIASTTEQQIRDVIKAHKGGTGNLYHARLYRGVVQGIIGRSEITTCTFR